MLKHILKFFYFYICPDFIIILIKLLYIKKSNPSVEVWPRTLYNISPWEINKISLWKKVILWNWNSYSWKISIWDYTYINSPNTKISGCNQYSISIGKYCSISWWVNIINHDKHNIDKLTTCEIHFKNKFQNRWGDINIWDDVWIGCWVTILPGITIGDWSIVWAGSVVTKDIEAYTVVAWIPAKKIKMRFNNEQISAIKKLNWTSLDLNKVEKILVI